MEYNTLHLAEAGVEAGSVHRQRHLSVGIVAREDVPKDIMLHTLDTKNTVVRNVEQMEMSYDKMKA